MKGDMGFAWALSFPIKSLSKLNWLPGTVSHKTLFSWGDGNGALNSIFLLWLFL